MIKKFFSFIINSFKKDLQTIKDMLNGKDYIKERAKLLASAFHPKEFLRLITQNWMFFLMLFLAFFCGWYYADQQCYENCANAWVDTIDYMYYDNSSTIKNVPIFMNQTNLTLILDNSEYSIYNGIH